LIGKPGRPVLEDAALLVVLAGGALRPHLSIVIEGVASGIVPWRPTIPKVTCTFQFHLREISAVAMPEVEERHLHQGIDNTD
jgi:hypothetical protein